MPRRMAVPSEETGKSGEKFIVVEETNDKHGLDYFQFDGLFKKKKQVQDIGNAELRCAILHNFSLFVGLIYYDR